MGSKRNLTKPAKEAHADIPVHVHVYMGGDYKIEDR